MLMSDEAVHYRSRAPCVRRALIPVRIDAGGGCGFPSAAATGAIAGSFPNP